MSGNRNSSVNWTWSFEDGDWFVETARNSLGGFANMVRRVEARRGTSVRTDLGRDGDGVGFTVTEGGGRL